MARPSQSVHDATPLDGEQIDVGARIGWLLRSSREYAGMSLRAMCGELEQHGVRVAYSSLSRIERGRWRRGDVIDAYELILGLEPGRLRGAVEVLCRTFPYGPADDEPTPASAQALAAYDDAVRAVGAGDPTGADWLRLARAQDPGRGFGLPTDDLRPLVERLTSELARAVGTAFVTRYEALARLRCGSYGLLVAEAGMAFLTEPGVQLVADVAGCLSEHASASLVAWAARQLSHPADLSMRAAATVLENVANAGHLPTAEWRVVPPDVVAAYERARDMGDRPRVERLDQMFATLPRAVRDAVRRGLQPPPAPVRAPSSWATIRSNRHFTAATELATTITGGHDEPLLTRLLFEMLYDFRPARSLNAALVVAASPYAAAAAEALTDVATHHPDELTRDGAAGALGPVLRAETRPPVEPWLDGTDLGLSITALIAGGMTGLELPEPRLQQLLRDPALRRWVVWYAGMAAPERLRLWTSAGLLTRDLAPAVAWWEHHGPRVVV